MKKNANRELKPRKFSTTNPTEAALLLYSGVEITKQSRRAGGPVRIYFNCGRQEARAMLRGFYLGTALVEPRRFSRALYSIHAYNGIPFRQ